MPRNRREEILERILAVLETIDGVKEVDGEKSVYRNRTSIPNELRPGIILLDGVQRKRTDTRGKTRMPHVEMMLLPQIFVLLELRENNENREVGEELSEFEKNILAALFTDGELWELLGGDSGQIEYTDLDTDMQTGSSMEGQMQLGLAFTYIFDPEEVIT